MGVLKTVAKLIGSLLALVVIGIGGLYVYYFVILPRDIAPPDLNVEITPARVERGEYLATAVFGCMYCHSERDWSLFGGPPVPGTLGKGGERFDQSVGVSGVLTSPNITPAGIGDWTDGEVYRSIVNGLHKDGYSLFPIMPFDVYLHMETEDIYSIIAYLRTLEPIEAEYSGRRMTALMQFIANSRVLPADPWTVDQDDPLSRAEYMVVIAGCRFCHTPANERMQPYEDKRFGGQVLDPGLNAGGDIGRDVEICPARGVFGFVVVEVGVVADLSDDAGLGNVIAQHGDLDFLGAHHAFFHDDPAVEA